MQYNENIYLAIQGLVDHKFRSFLTMLGIIFGVAAVITMLAIGNGARQEILDQMKLVGVNNIIIQPVIEESDEDEEEDQSETTRFSPGLTMEDAQSIL